MAINLPCVHAHTSSAVSMNKLHKFKLKDMYVGALAFSAYCELSSLLLAQFGDCLSPYHTLQLHGTDGKPRGHSRYGFKTQ